MSEGVGLNKVTSKAPMESKVPGAPAHAIGIRFKAKDPLLTGSMHYRIPGAIGPQPLTTKVSYPAYSIGGKYEVGSPETPGGGPGSWQTLEPSAKGMIEKEKVTQRANRGRSSLASRRPSV